MEALTDLALIWVAVYVAVVAARKTRLTSVLYFLFLGFVMVNTGLLPHEGHPFVRGFAELGIIVIMFTLGFEETTNNFLLSIKKSWGIAFFGALAPFVVTYSIADYYWQDTNLALMCGLAMTMTAVSLTMVSLRSEGLQATPAATRIMTSAVLDNIGSLALVAILVPLATGERVTGLDELSIIIGKLIVFFILVWIAAAWLLPHELRGWIRRVPIIGQFGREACLVLRRWAVRHARGLDHGAPCGVVGPLLRVPSGHRRLYGRSDTPQGIFRAAR